VLPAIQEQLSRCEPDHSTIHLDLSGVSWETIFQDVVRRSNTLKFISIISSFTCSKMEPTPLADGGRYHRHKHSRKSTEDILEELLEEEEAGLFAPISSEKDARQC